MSAVRDVPPLFDGTMRNRSPLNTVAAIAGQINERERVHYAKGRSMKRWPRKGILGLFVSYWLIQAGTAWAGPYVNAMQPCDCPENHYSAMHVLTPVLWRWAAWCQGPCHYTFARASSRHPDDVQRQEVLLSVRQSAPVFGAELRGPGRQPSFVAAPNAPAIATR